MSYDVGWIGVPFMNCKKIQLQNITNLRLLLFTPTLFIYNNDVLVIIKFQLKVKYRVVNT